MKKLLGLLLLFFVFSIPSFANEANDPTVIGVGARALGLGNCFVAIDNDPSSIFFNPAELSGTKNLQLTSMTGKFINAVDYYMVAGALPVDYGTWGFGYSGSYAGFTTPSYESIGGTPIVSSQESNYKHSNTALLVSFSPKNEVLNENIRSILADNTSIGATFRLYMQNLSGTSIGDLSATGINLDLGLSSKITKASRWDLSLQNVLPESLGGKLNWSDGTSETYATGVKVGYSTKLIDRFNPPKNIPKDWEDLDLSMSVALDFYPSVDYIPTTWHLGFELSPTELMDIRTGIDQGINQGNVASNFTAGIGLYLKDFRFDYAYHSYFDISENATHYFSLSYGVGKPTKAKKQEEEELIKITSPEDKTIFYTDSAEIKGTTQKINLLTINSFEVSLADDGSFAETVSLTKGKNIYMFRGFNSGNNLVATKKLNLPRLVSFKDVGPAYWAKLPIESLATLNMVSGYPNGNFFPEKTITRAELATLMMKISGMSSEALAPIPIFKDVPSKHWASKYIYQGVKIGIVTGYPGARFMPNKAVTRAEGVAIISRFANLSKSRVLTGPYVDVPGRHWAVQEITTAKEAGLLKYLGDGKFEPNKSLTRAEAAEILSKTEFAAGKIADIFE